MWCEIRVRGHLGDTWSAWFDGLTVTSAERGESVLTGAVADQAALHGILLKVRDLGIPLIALSCMGHNREHTLSVFTSDELDESDLRQLISKGLTDPGAGTGQGDEDD